MIEARFTIAPPRPRGKHMAGCRLRAQKDAGQIDRYDLVPIGKRQFDSRPADADAGAVDEDVEPAMPRNDGLDRAPRPSVCRSRLPVVSGGRTPRSAPHLLRAAASARAGSRSRMATAAPAPAKAAAVARPMPLPPPVTRATLPSSRNIERRFFHPVILISLDCKAPGPARLGKARQ